MALTTHPSRCGVRVRSVTGRQAGRGIYGACESPIPTRAVNHLPRPAPPLRPAPVLMKLCTRCSVSTWGAARRPCVVSRRREQARRRRCVSAGRSTRPEQTKPRLPRACGCNVRMQRARVTRTRRETLRGRADAASTTEGFLEGIYMQKDGSPDGLKAEELLSLLKKSEHWSLFPSSSQLCLK